MKTSTLFRTLPAACLFTSLSILSTRIALGDAHYLGTTADCKKCHEPEVNVWQATKHATSVGTLHQPAKTKADYKKIIAAVGGSNNPKRNETCIQCHYTDERKPGEAAAVVKSSVSCESCHGPASDWFALHNDYGEGVKEKAQEPAAHREKRIADSVKAGMIRPEMRYEAAANCLGCHNLARASLSGEVIGKMIDAGHPINPDYELVKYSQGTVRHRFYNDKGRSENQQMSQEELARWFVTGAAVKFVNASANEKKSDNAKYQEVQKKHLESSKAVLSAVKSVPEAAALLAAPTEANARKLVTAIATKDLSGEVKAMLPAPGDYK